MLTPTIHHNPTQTQIHQIQTPTPVLRTVSFATAVPSPDPETVGGDNHDVPRTPASIRAKRKLRMKRCCSLGSAMRVPLLPQDPAPNFEPESISSEESFPLLPASNSSRSVAIQPPSTPSATIHEPTTTSTLSSPTSNPSLSRLAAIELFKEFKPLNNNPTTSPTQQPSEEQQHGCVVEESNVQINATKKQTLPSTLVTRVGSKSTLSHKVSTTLHSLPQRVSSVQRTDPLVMKSKCESNSNERKRTTTTSSFCPSTKPITSTLSKGHHRSTTTATATTTLHSKGITKPLVRSKENQPLSREEQQQLLELEAIMEEHNKKVKAANMNASALNSHGYVPRLLMQKKPTTKAT
jgi:hypothetical protein